MEGAVPAHHIKIGLLGKGLICTNGDSRVVALMIYFGKHPDFHFDASHQFCASKGFINDLKRRNRLPSRSAPIERRSLVDLKAIDCFKYGMEILIRDTNRYLSLNRDETAWRPFPSRILMWAPTETGNVQIHIKGDDQTAITALAKITASGKVTTIRCGQSQAGILKWPYRDTQNPVGRLIPL
jgi:hypothetical protein